MTARSPRPGRRMAAGLRPPRISSAGSAGLDPDASDSAARCAVGGARRRRPQPAASPGPGSLPTRFAVALAVLLVTAACTGPAPQAAAMPGRCIVPPAPSPAERSESRGSGGAASAADRLAGLASAVGALPGDARDPRVYRFSATHAQNWTVTDGGIAATDVTVWRASDGSGRIIQRTLPLRPGPARLADAAERARLAAAPAQTTTYPHDGVTIGGVVPEPVPADTATLTAALYAARPGSCYPQALLGDVAYLAGVHYLDRAARAATLRVLATIAGLGYDGVARDLAGRTGWSFHADDGPVRTTILLDPATGSLLACSITSAAGAPHLLTHTLYLAADRTMAVGQAVEGPL